MGCAVFRRARIRALYCSILCQELWSLWRASWLLPLCDRRWTRCAEDDWTNCFSARHPTTIRDLESAGVWSENCRSGPERPSPVQAMGGRLENHGWQNHHHAQGIEIQVGSIGNTRHLEPHHRSNRHVLIYRLDREAGPGIKKYCPRLHDEEWTDQHGWLEHA